MSRLVPNRLALIFDGWTNNSTHYISVFAPFSTTNEDSFATRLLSVSLMGDESRLDADEHIDFLTYILNLYGKSWTNVTCLIGDNVSVNCSVANKTGISYIGCASHRLNLAVQDFIKVDELLISKVNNLMVKLRNLLLSAKLRRLTPFRPKLRNSTSWNSIFDIIARYLQIRTFLPSLD